ncbi:chromate efflux transporter [Desulfovibrio psychrotolerans]|uniref:Chromate transporter n=1 Tax=Desulfovibrio psychrotolerans TaxID=415242 RepID=A0A7J0BWK0_9BACT|nr:chromate efflux transporter [Desulfovibrio psychrotolerans]GFM38087.1 chromate transporter [Desulfovibrio psychrotolerans]
MERINKPAGAQDLSGAERPSDGEESAGNVRFVDAAALWLRVGLFSFGGPAGQVAMMYRMVVEERRWVSNGRFLHALNYCNLLPGPEAQQLATYVGWLLHGTRGGLVAGTLFILPGFLVVLALSALYAAFSQVPAVEALFWGLKPAVLAVVVMALMRIGSKALVGAYAWALAFGAFLALFVFGVPFPLVVLMAGILGWARHEIGANGTGTPASSASSGSSGTQDEDEEPVNGREHAAPTVRGSLRVLATWLTLWLVPVFLLLAILGPENVYARIAVFFSKMAVVSFGGAYAVLAYVAQAAVADFGWLSAEDMLNGLGLAESTPGPLILVLEYVGYLAAYRNAGDLPPALAGMLGATLAVWVTFTPCFLWIFLGAPFIERLRGVRALSAALSGITASVVGVIFNLALWFALHSLFGRVDALAFPGGSLPVPDMATADVPALVLAFAAFVALHRLWLGMIPVLAGCAAAGMLWRLVL